MKILVDILHPAHVHFFRHFITEMEGRGHSVIAASRRKEMTAELLDQFGIPHRILSGLPQWKIGLPFELLARTARLIRLAREVEADVLTGIMGPCIAPAGRLLGIPAIVFYDTEHAPTNRFSYPLAHSVCTPESYTGTVRGRHITYPGYHELAYLHPERFTPDPSILSQFGLSDQEPYFLVRFVSWQSIHDIGDRGLSVAAKTEVVKRLEKSARVVISSEGAVPQSLKAKLLNGPVDKVHHVIAHATGIVGESATMCSEAAVLGVPAIYVNPLVLGYLREQEREYGLVRNLLPENEETLFSAVSELPWNDVDQAHRRLLQDKIDVTSWMTEYFAAEFGN